jgi:hypothetical protein
MSERANIMPKTFNIQASIKRKRAKGNEKKWKFVLLLSNLMSRFHVQRLVEQRRETGGVSRMT